MTWRAGRIFRGMRATTRRRLAQGFAPYPEDYHRRLWAVFGASGQAHLLIAEHGGEPLSAALLHGGADAPRGVAFFKLGFGGEPVIYPGTYDLVPGGGLTGLALRTVLPRAGRFRGVVHRLSGRGAYSRVAVASRISTARAPRRRSVQGQTFVPDWGRLHTRQLP